MNMSKLHCCSALSDSYTLLIPVSARLHLTNLFLGIENGPELSLQTF